jgi:glycosyltransferase involved in cell wall biosynthesis
MFGSKMKRLLFLTPNPIESASERYRIFQFLPHLERAGFRCTVWPFANRSLHRAIQQERLLPKLALTPLGYLQRAAKLPLVSRFDAVIVHRGIFPFPWPALEKHVVRNSARVVFDFDDAIHIGHQDFNGAAYPWIYKLKYGPGVNELLRHSTHVIAGNQSLADHARQFNSQVSVIPTVIDADQYSYRVPRNSEGPITIGWVGSRSTSPYLLAIEPALRKLSTLHPGRVRFRLFGHVDRKLDLPNFESLPFSLASEIDDLRTIDIGLMPMPDNQWTRGKCAFKAIQYMALGIPTVASPVGMTTELIDHGTDGFLARTSDEWLESLDRLVSALELRRKLAEAGRQTVLTRYSLQAWSPRLIDLIESILLQPRPVMARTASAIN